LDRTHHTSCPGVKPPLYHPQGGLARVKSGRARFGGDPPWAARVPTSSLPSSGRDATMPLVK
jgi:hypothetical protein